MSTDRIGSIHAQFSCVRVLSSRIRDGDGVKKSLRMDQFNHITFGMHGRLILFVCGNNNNSKPFHTRNKGQNKHIFQKDQLTTGVA